MFNQKRSLRLNLNLNLDFPGRMLAVKLSVVVPVYNEERTIGEVLRRIRAVRVEKEIIVVDDGSTDGTWEVLQRARGSGLVLHRSEFNCGKGAAVRTGFGYVTGDVVIVQDADLELDPSDYPALLEPILRGESEVVYGSRFLDRKERGPFLRTLANRGLTRLTNFLYGTSLTDMETCYKVFRSHILDTLALRSQRFDFEPEITAKLVRMGYGIVEVPVRYTPRTAKEGKKIGWRDGVKAIWVLIRCRFFG